MAFLQVEIRCNLSSSAPALCASSCAALGFLQMYMCYILAVGRFYILTWGLVSHQGHFIGEAYCHLDCTGSHLVGQSHSFQWYEIFCLLTLYSQNSCSYFACFVLSGGDHIMPYMQIKSCVSQLAKLLLCMVNPFGPNYHNV